MKKFTFLVLSFFLMGFTEARELTDCKEDLKGRIEQIERGSFQRALLLNPEVQTWIKAGKSFLEAFQLAEPYQEAPGGSPESFLYGNALQSCLDFRQSFESQMMKIQWMTFGISLGVVLALSLVIFWRFR